MLPLSPVLLLCASVQAQEAVERRVLSMGTTLSVRVEAEDRFTALAASEAAVRAVEATEERLATRGEGSELDALAAAPEGAWVALSPELARDLALAAACWEATQGGFDLTLGHAEAFVVDGQRARRLGPLLLDAGGIGKGIALDAGVDAALAAGAEVVTLDLGGQLAAHGEPLLVDLAHPVLRDRVSATISVHQASVATSGQGQQPGHIVDPRSGEAVPAWGSVSVVATSAARADCLATGLFVLGPVEALEAVESLPGVEIIVQELGPDGVVLHHGEGGAP